MDGLPLELQFLHSQFMASVEKMSPEQMRETLAVVHRSYLAHRAFLKDQLHPGRIS